MDMASQFTAALNLPEADCLACVDAFNPLIVGQMGDNSYVLLQFVDQSGVFIDRIPNKNGALDYSVISGANVVEDISMICLDMILLKPKHPFSKDKAFAILSTFIADGLKRVLAELETPPSTALH